MGSDDKVKDFLLDFFKGVFFLGIAIYPGYYVIKLIKELITNCGCEKIIEYFLLLLIFVPFSLFVGFLIVLSFMSFRECVRNILNKSD